MKIVKIAVTVAVAALLVVAMTMPGVTKQKVKTKAEIKTGEVLKADNFVLVIDQSNEMNVVWPPGSKKSKAFIAKEIALGFLRAVPDLPGIKGAIYMYGVLAKDAPNTVMRVMKMQNFQGKRASYVAAINTKVAANSGLSTMSWALKAVKDDLGNVPGKTAVIIISGGNKSDWGKPSHEAADLKQTYGPRLCIWTVLVGQSSDGGRFLKGLVDDGKCGKANNADSLTTDHDFRKWSRDIFFEVSGDADMDGVPDSQDQCPSTPYGARVDARGCWILQNVNFDFNKADIKPQYFTILDQVASVLIANPDVGITIEGHTDSKGGDDYNMKLSQQRADSVKNYLVGKGVAGSRLSTRGYGKTRPIATNDTEEGRALNRRIELTPSRQ